jgi:hypothetical protein
VLTVTADNQSKVYGADNPALTGSLAGVQNNDRITASYATAATQGSSVGDYVIVATLVDPDGKLGNYTVTTNNGTLTVTPASLKVMANNAARTYGADNPAFSGTITGLQNGDSMTATYGSAATPSSAVGTYPITPTLTDLTSKLANYNISYANGTLTVTAAGLLVTVNNASRAYGATNPVFSGAITGLLNGDDITATYACAATPSSTVGTYPITPTLVDPSGKLSNYAISSTNGTLTVVAAALTVTANDAARGFGTPNPAFTGAINGIQSSDGISATYACPATLTSPVGTYPIRPTLIDPGQRLSNYTVTINNGTLTITNSTTPAILGIAPAGSGNVVITWAALSNSVYRVQYKASLASTNWVDLAPDVVATGSTASFTDHPGGAAQRYYRILFVSSEPPAAPVIQSIVGAGTPNVVITWSAISNRVYRVQYRSALTGAPWLNLAPDVTATGSTASFTDHPGGAALRFYRVVLLSTVTPLTPLAVTVNNASRVYGDANPVLGGSITGVQSGDNITAIYTTTTTPGSRVGTYPITPILVDPDGKLDNYLVTITDGPLTVTAAPLTVAVNSSSRAYGATNPIFSGTITGLLNADNITATYACAATPSSTVGTYSITPTLADPDGKLSNYTLISSNGTLSVTRAGLTVTANNASRTYGAANPVFTGAITGIQNNDAITATYASTATTSSPPGTYPIVPSLADPGNRLPNYDVTVNNGALTVTGAGVPTILSIVASGKTNIVITWSALSNSVYRVQYKSALAGTNWISLTPDVVATGSTASFTDHPGTNSQRFYRVLMNPPVTVQTPTAVGIKGNGDGTVTVTFAGTPGAQYLVQATTNVALPTAWVSVSTNSAGTDGRWTFTDSKTTRPQRFYRAATP